MIAINKASDISTCWEQGLSLKKKTHLLSSPGYISFLTKATTVDLLTRFAPGCLLRFSDSTPGAIVFAYTNFGQENMHVTKYDF